MMLSQDVGDEVLGFQFQCQALNQHKEVVKLHLWEFVIETSMKEHSTNFRQIAAAVFQIYKSMIFWGCFLGVPYGAMFSIVLFISGFRVPFFHAILYGLIVGMLTGFLNGFVLLVLLTISAKTTEKVLVGISSLVMFVIFSIIFLFLSPTILHILTFAFVATCGSAFSVTRIIRKYFV